MTPNAAKNMDLVTWFKDKRIGAQIICFSELENDLSMWRGYGNVGNKNDGVAIGFNFEDLRTLAGSSDNQLSGFSEPQECIYNENAIQTQLDKEFLGHLESDNALALLRAESFLKKSMPLEKSHHFECEKEWRIFCPNSVSSIDVGRGLVTEVGGTYRKHFRLPYVHPNDGSGTMADPMGISEIMAGPNTNFEKLEVFCSTAFGINGCDYPTISKSKIPFV